MKTLFTTVALLFLSITLIAQNLKPVSIPYSLKIKSHSTVTKITSESFYHYDTLRNVKVQSKGREILLNKEDVAFVKSQLPNQKWMLSALDNSNIIRNNDVADLIFLIISKKQNLTAKI